MVRVKVRARVGNGLVKRRSYVGIRHLKPQTIAYSQTPVFISVLLNGFIASIRVRARARARVRNRARVIKNDE